MLKKKCCLSCANSVYEFAKREHVQLSDWLVHSRRPIRAPNGLSFRSRSTLKNCTAINARES
uniref:SFRICE_026220 n=1 Tax=Spodoptera frugiperda TaxID=7108 RepID=A0A2H1V162_SPOFR